jgi:uncharacterized protein
MAKPVKFTEVTFSDTFWGPLIKTNREITLQAEYKQCKDSGRIDTIAGRWDPEDEQDKDKVFSRITADSDLAKWIEAAAYEIAKKPDTALEAQVDELVEYYRKMQLPDGYVHSYYCRANTQKRWSNLRDNHEMYSIGHLIEAAVAYFEATGKRTFLDIMLRCVDCIDRTFGREQGKKRGYCGHPEIELALIRLYKLTGDKKHLKLAKYFIDERGAEPSYFDAEALERGEDPKKWWWNKSYDVVQAHKPVRQFTAVEGHAVRAFYLYCGIIDTAVETNDQELIEVCERLWKDFTTKKMYITAGAGASRHNEGFTTDYDLPNDNAYAETCAGIGVAFFAHRMLQYSCDSAYTDVIERAFYNGIISGVSMDGRKFLYVNPLASSGAHHRVDWFFCSCCPPNIARLLASAGGYVYSQTDNEAIVHLYAQGTGKLTVGGEKLLLTQTTNYPWDGNVSIKLSPSSPHTFTLKLRIPGWCKKYMISINGEIQNNYTIDKGYIALDKMWQDGDVVDFSMDMPVERVHANPRVKADIGRVALQRGPIVYCLEQADNPFPLESVFLLPNEQIDCRFDENLLGGVVTLQMDALRCNPESGEELYNNERPALVSCTIQAVPYARWDNRAPGEMLVWIKEKV